MNSKRLIQLEEMASQNPEDPFFIYAMAMEWQYNDKTKSITLLEKLSIQFPDYLPSYYQLAYLLYEDENYLKALEICKKGIILATELNEQKTLGELKNLLSNIEIEL